MTTAVPPPLKVREIPFDLRRGFQLRFARGAREYFESLYAIDGPAYVFDRLAASLRVEMAEHVLRFAEQNLAAYNHSPAAKDFITQELRHAGYHNQLNKCFAGEYIRTPYVPKVNRLVYPLFATRLAPILKAAGSAPDVESRGAALRQLYFFVGVSETSIGVLTAVTQFRWWDDGALQRFLDVDPFWLYLWGYHLTEELEHVHVPLEAYEILHGESFFSPAKFAIASRLMDEFAMGVRRLAMQIALESDQVLTMEDLDATRLAAGRSQLLRDHVKEGFDVADIQDLRERYVARWDDEWEPEVRARCEELLAAAPA